MTPGEWSITWTYDELVEDLRRAARKAGLLGELRPDPPSIFRLAFLVPPEHAKIRGGVS